MVNFPKALRAEQSVAMDLKIRQGVVVKNKELATISEEVIVNWIGAGHPRIGNIHTNNGGELCGDATDKLASIMGAMRTTTAGRAPYQDRMYERAHQTLDHRREGVMEEDPKTREKVALRANARQTADKKEVGTWVHMKRMKEKFKP